MPEIAQVRVPPFKGLVSDPDPHLLAPGELSLAHNVVIGSRGAIRPAPEPGTDSGATDNLYGIRLFSEAQQVGGGYIAVCDDGDLERDVGTASRSTIPTSWGAPAGVDEYHVPMEALGDNIYCTRKDSITPVRVTLPSGGGVSITATVFDGTSGTFPRAQHLAVKDSVMFAANVLSGATEYSSRIHWSEPADPQTWPAANYIDIDPDDGEEITALAVFGEDLVIFKQTKMYLLTGRSEASYAVLPLDAGVGTMSPYTVQVWSNWLVFYSSDMRLVAFDGAGFTDLGGDNRYVIKNIMGSSSQYLHRVVGAAAQSKYYLSTLSLDGPTAYPSYTFIYDRDTDSWTTMSAGFSGMAYRAAKGGSWGGALAVCGVQTDYTARRGGRVIYPLHDIGFSGTRKTNNVIIRTGWSNFGGADSQTRVRQIVTTWLKPYTSNGETVVMRMYADGDANTAVKTDTISIPAGTLRDDGDPHQGLSFTSAEAYRYVTTGFSDTRYNTLMFEFEFTTASSLVYGCSLLSVDVSVSMESQVRGSRSV